MVYLYKTENGRATDVTFATYENRFNYSFNFDSMMIKKGVEQMIRICYDKLSKNQIFQWSI